MSRRLRIFFGRMWFTWSLGLAIVLMLFSFMGMALSHPDIQYRLVQGLQQFIYKQTGANVEIEQVQLAIPNRIVLRGVEMQDELHKPLLRINELKLDILSFSLWRWIRGEEGLSELYVRYVELDAVDFYLEKRPDSVFNIDFLKGNSPDSVRSSPNLSILLPEIHLKNCRFQFVDHTHPEVDILKPGTINFRNLEIQGIYSALNFSYEPGNLQSRVQRLRASEKRTGFQLEDLQTLLITDWEADTQFVSFRELSFLHGKTKLYGHWNFPNQTLDEVVDQWVELPSQIELIGSTIDMETFEYFLSEPIPVEGSFQVEGMISGTLEELRSEKLRLSYKDSTSAELWMRIKHLDDETRPIQLDLRTKRAQLWVKHLREIKPDLSLPFNWERLGEVGIQGSFSGIPEEFVVDAMLDTRLGSASTILRINPGDEARNLPIQYAGFAKTFDLQWDALGISPQVSSERLTLEAKINGQGSNLQDLATQLDMRITSSLLWGREVDTLYGNVRIADRKIEGMLDLHDRLGKAQVQANLNLLDSPALYQVSGRLDAFNLKKFLNLEQDLDISGDLNLDLEGDSLENVSGNVNMQNMVLQSPVDSSLLQVPDLEFLALNNTLEQKYIILRSDLLDAELEGNFTFKNALPLARRLVEESRLFIQNDTSKIRSYYENKVVDPDPVRIFLALVSKDSINSLFEFLGESFRIAPGASLNSRFRFGPSERAQISGEFDSLQIGNIRGRDIALNLDLLKYSDRNSLLVVGDARIDTLRVYPDLFFRDITLDINGLDRVVETDLFAFQGDSENKAQLEILTNFPQTGRMVSSIDSRSTYIMFQEDSLTVNDYNAITYFSSENRWLFQDFILSGERGKLTVKGDLAKDSTSLLTAGLENFDLEHLQVFFPVKYIPDGMAKIEVSGQELLGEGKLSFKTDIEDFALNEYTYGRVELGGTCALSPLNLDLKATLKDEGQDMIILNGSYESANEQLPLNAQIGTDKGFPLAYISPFVEGQLYGLSGQVALDSFNIAGNLDDFEVNGTGHFENTKVGIDYFQSDYRFDADITFDNDRIYFQDITLLDKEGQTADLHGTIYHKGLQEFEFDLQMDKINNFLLIDTKAADNDLFYGKLYLKNGIASITGNLDQLDIQAYVMSGRGTQLKIPITYGDAIETPDYIRFVGGSEETSRVAVEESGLKGFELNISVQATPDAVIELIFDEKVGDIIRMQGEGTIKFNVNEKGDFSMLGTYEIQQGDYLFTARNVLNKKFQVRTGGTISWSGNPYEGRLNLKAFYPLYADISDLIQSDETRRIGTNVLMDMQGSLLQPEIELSIEIPNLREQEALSIASILRTIQYDEQELNKQVFSLMVFNRFAPVGGFLDENVANTGVSTSISELLSNQLNYWLSQALNEKVNVNVGTSNFQDVNLLISARLFDDRVRIERDGILIGPGNSGIEVGNIKIIIRLIRPDNAANRQGELVLEVFNRESLDLTQQFTIQRGLGVFYKRNFDSLKELLGGKKEE